MCDQHQRDAVGGKEAEAIAGQDAVSCWEERCCTILKSIAALHVETHDYTTAVHMSSMLLQVAPTRPDYVSDLGKLHLHLGDIDSAAQCFQSAEALFLDPTNAVAATLCPPTTAGPWSSDNHPKVLLNRGFMAVARGDFDDASAHFLKVLEISPGDITASNNLAVCFVYQCRVSEAIHQLEETVRQQCLASGYLSEDCEVLLANLATNYDLAHDDAGQRRGVLRQVMERYALDSFDMSICGSS
jgi:tetratricopeptide (TPR) repeat protein